jgi:hypothetical protein
MLGFLLSAFLNPKEEVYAIAGVMTTVTLLIFTYIGQKIHRSIKKKPIDDRILLSGPAFTEPRQFAQDRQRDLYQRDIAEARERKAVLEESIKSMMEYVPNPLNNGRFNELHAQLCAINAEITNALNNSFFADSIQPKSLGVDTIFDGNTGKIIKEIHIDKPKAFNIKKAIKIQAASLYGTMTVDDFQEHLLEQRVIQREITQHGREQLQAQVQAMMITQNSVYGSHGDTDPLFSTEYLRKTMLGDED